MVPSRTSRRSPKLTPSRKEPRASQAAASQDRGRLRPATLLLQLDSVVVLKRRGISRPATAITSSHGRRFARLPRRSHSPSTPSSASFAEPAISARSTPSNTGPTAVPDRPVPTEATSRPSTPSTHPPQRATDEPSRQHTVVSASYRPQSVDTLCSCGAGLLQGAPSIARATVCTMWLMNPDLRGLNRSRLSTSGSVESTELAVVIDPSFV